MRTILAAAIAAKSAPIANGRSAAGSVILSSSFNARSSRSSLELLHGVLNQTIYVGDVSVIADHIEPVSFVVVD